MKAFIKIIFVLVIIISGLNSCLVTTSPRYHHFNAENNIASDPELTIFSTSAYKSYVVTNADVNTQIFIKSPVLKIASLFYLMENQDFFDKKAKQYRLAIKDRNFYRTDDYKHITLKIINGEAEKIIEYKMIENGNSKAK